MYVRCIDYWLIVGHLRTFPLFPSAKQNIKRKDHKTALYIDSTEDDIDFYKSASTAKKHKTFYTKLDECIPKLGEVP